MKLVGTVGFCHAIVRARKSYMISLRHAKAHFNEVEFVAEMRSFKGQRGIWHVGSSRIFVRRRGHYGSLQQLDWKSHSKQYAIPFEAFRVSVNSLLQISLYRGSVEKASWPPLYFKQASEVSCKQVPFVFSKTPSASSVLLPILRVLAHMSKSTSLFTHLVK